MSNATPWDMTELRRALGVEAPVAPAPIAPEDEVALYRRDVFAAWTTERIETALARAEAEVAQDFGKVYRARWREEGARQRRDHLSLLAQVLRHRRAGLV